jgi:hypothetical protein
MVPAGIAFPCYSSNNISPEMLKILTKKKKKRYKSYTELLEGNNHEFGCVRELVICLTCH